jgi:hypothetical protein
MLPVNYRPTEADLEKAMEIAWREFGNDIGAAPPEVTEAENDFSTIVIEAFNGSPTGRVYGEDHGEPLTIGQALRALDKRWGGTTDHWGNFEKRPSTTKLETR